MTITPKVPTVTPVELHILTRVREGRDLTAFPAGVIDNLRDRGFLALTEAFALTDAGAIALESFSKQCTAYWHEGLLTQGTSGWCRLPKGHAGDHSPPGVQPRETREKS